MSRDGLGTTWGRPVDRRGTEGAVRWAAARLGTAGCGSPHPIWDGGSGVASAGIRFFGERLSADLALWTPIGADDFFVLPVVNFKAVDLPTFPQGLGVVWLKS